MCIQGSSRFNCPTKELRTKGSGHQRLRAGETFVARRRTCWACPLGTHRVSLTLARFSISVAGPCDQRPFDWQRPGSMDSRTHNLKLVSGCSWLQPRPSEASSCGIERRGKWLSERPCQIVLQEFCEKSGCLANGGSD